MVYVPFVVAMIGRGAFASGETAESFEEGLSPIAIIGFLLTAIGLGAWCWLTILYVKRNGQSIAEAPRHQGGALRRIPGDARTDLLAAQCREQSARCRIARQILDVLFIFGETRQCLHDKIADTIVVRA